MTELLVSIAAQVVVAARVALVTALIRRSSAPPKRATLGTEPTAAGEGRSGRPRR